MNTLKIIAKPVLMLLKLFDVVLEQEVSQEKSGLSLGRLWLLGISDGQLVLRGNE